MTRERLAVEGGVPASVGAASTAHGRGSERHVPELTRHPASAGYELSADQQRTPYA